MGGIYYNIWSCSNCDYTSRSVSGPFRVEPKTGTPKAKIEYRWCNDCKAIQRTFTGKGDGFMPGDEPDTKINRWQFKNLQELNIAINELEAKKKSNFFFFLTSDSKRLKEYKEKVSLYVESEMICEKMTNENIDFYNKLKPTPKCLICNGTNVSKVSFDKDIHSCGGQFIRKDSGRVGSVSQVQVITYSSDGTSTSEMKNMR